jgi:hypothetical protein
VQYEPMLAAVSVALGSANPLSFTRSSAVGGKSTDRPHQVIDGHACRSAGPWFFPVNQGLRRIAFPLRASKLTKVNEEEEDPLAEGGQNIMGDTIAFSPAPYTTRFAVTASHEATAWRSSPGPRFLQIEGLAAPRGGRA